MKGACEYAGVTFWFSQYTGKRPEYSLKKRLGDFFFFFYRPEELDITCHARRDMLFRFCRISIKYIINWIKNSFIIRFDSDFIYPRNYYNGACFWHIGF